MLDPKLGGPSIFTPAPAFLFVPPASYGPFNWVQAEGRERYRRALYTFRRRSTPCPALQTFDAPPGESSCVRRSRTNTPLQALTTLNETVFVECARGLAARVLRKVTWRLLPLMALMSTWKWSGISMLIYLSGLHEIPVELYEASEVDGAGAVPDSAGATCLQALPDEGFCPLHRLGQRRP